MNIAKRLTAVAGIVLVSLALTGCSGINASHSVSPASFLLPGLIQYPSQPPSDEPGCARATEIALLTDPLN